MAAYEERDSLRRVAEQQVGLLLQVGSALKQQASSAAQAMTTEQQAERKAKQDALAPFLEKLTAAVLRKTLAGAADVCLAQAESGERDTTAATCNLSETCRPWGDVQALHSECWNEVNSVYLEYGKQLSKFFEGSRYNEKMFSVRRSFAEKLPALKPYVHKPNYAISKDTPASVLEKVPATVLELYNRQLVKLEHPDRLVAPALELTHSNAVPRAGVGSTAAPRALYKQATKRRMVEIVEKHRASVAPQWAKYISEPATLTAAAADGSLMVEDEMDAVLMAAHQDVQALLPSVAPRKFAELVAAGTDGGAAAVADAGGVLGVGAASASGFLPTGGADFRQLESAAGAAFLSSGLRHGGAKRPRAAEDSGHLQVRLEHVVEWLRDHQRFPGARAALGAGLDRLQQEVDFATAESDVLMTVQRATVKKQRKAMESAAAKAAAGHAATSSSAAAADVVPAPAATAGSAAGPAAENAADAESDDEAEL